MSEWIEKPLGEVTSYLAKGIPPKYTEELTEDAIYVLNQKCNRDFVISYDAARFHDLTQKKVAEEKMVQPGDVLINSTGEGTAGRVAQIWDLPYPTTTDGHMILIRPTAEVDPLYYGYAVKAYQSQIETLAEGSTGQTEINKKRLQDEIIIRFPKDKDVQHRVAEVLENIDRKIAVNNKINRNLEEQAKSIFKDRFIDFNPFGGVMPSDWRELTLADVSELSAGGDKPNKVSSTSTDELNIPIYSNGISNEGLYGFTDNAKIFKESVTVSARGTIGYVCLRQTPYLPIVRLVSLVPKCEYISAKYLYHWLGSLHISGTGTTQLQLTVPDFKKTRIVIPTKEFVDDFTEIVAPMYDEILRNKAQNSRLSDIRDTLLPKLMSGELDVSDLDI